MTLQGGLSWTANLTNLLFLSRPTPGIVARRRCEWFSSSICLWFILLIDLLFNVASISDPGLNEFRVMQVGN